MQSTESTIRGLEHQGAKALLVTSTGGHLAEVQRIVDRLELSADSLWVTFSTVQSEASLCGCRVEYLPFVRSARPEGCAAGRAAAAAHPQA